MRSLVCLALAIGIGCAPEAGPPAAQSRSPGPPVAALGPLARLEAGAIAIRPSASAPAVRLRTRTIEGLQADVLGDDATATTADVVERWTHGSGALAQSWSFDTPRSSEIVVRVGLEGADEVAREDDGLRIRVPGSRTGLRYSDATWIDASGARTPIAASWEDGAITLRVPASIVASSSFPALLDPIVGPEVELSEPVITTAPIGTADLAAVSAPGGGHLVATSAPGRVLIDPIDPGGVPRLSLPRVVDSSDPRGSRVALATIGAQPMIAYVGATSEDRRPVWVRSVDADGVPGPPMRAGDVNALRSEIPVVLTNDAGRALVAWRSDTAAVALRRLAPDGTIAASGEIAESGSCIAWDFAVASIATSSVVGWACHDGTALVVQLVALDEALGEVRRWTHEITRGAYGGPPRITLAPGAGEVIAAWQDGTGVHALRVDPSRATLAPAIGLETAVAWDTRVGLAPHRDGFLAAWRTETELIAVELDGGLTERRRWTLTALSRTSGAVRTVVVPGAAPAVVWAVHDGLHLALLADDTTIRDVPLHRRAAWQHGIQIAHGRRATFSIWAEEGPRLAGAMQDDGGGTPRALAVCGARPCTASDYGYRLWATSHGDGAYFLWSYHRATLEDPLLGTEVRADGTVVSPGGQWLSGTTPLALVLISTGAGPAILRRGWGGIEALRVLDGGLGAPVALPATLGSSWTAASIPGGGHLLASARDGGLDLAALDEGATRASPVRAFGLGSLTRETPLASGAGRDRFGIAWVRSDGAIALLETDASGWPAAEPMVIPTGAGFTTVLATVHDGRGWAIVALRSDGGGSTLEWIEADPTPEVVTIAGPDPSVTEWSARPVVLDPGRVLVAYVRPRDDAGANRVHTRVIVRPGELGDACGHPDACASGHCVDGTCCDGTCGGGSDSDCLRCDGDGTETDAGHCGVTWGQTCRDTVGPCDPPESCEGAELCPPDQRLPRGAWCDDGDACTADEVCAEDGLCVTGRATCDDGDACTVDHCVDGACSWEGACDAGTPDAGSARDAGPTRDAGVADGGLVGDAGDAVDASSDAMVAAMDASGGPGDAAVGADPGSRPAVSGCGCRVVPVRLRATALGTGLLVLVVLVARRRARQRSNRKRSARGRVSESLGSWCAPS